MPTIFLALEIMWTTNKWFLIMRSLYWDWEEDITLVLFIKGGGFHCERTLKMLSEHRVGTQKRGEKVSWGKWCSKWGLWKAPTRGRYIPGRKKRNCLGQRGNGKVWCQKKGWLGTPSDFAFLEIKWEMRSERGHGIKNPISQPGM